MGKSKRKTPEEPKKETPKKEGWKKLPEWKADNAPEKSERELLSEKFRKMRKGQ